MKLPIRHEAIIELDEAVEFYEQQELGLGLALLDEVEAVIEYASEASKDRRREGLFGILGFRFFRSSQERKSSRGLSPMVSNP